MKNIKKYIIGIAASICLTQCDVLDVDPVSYTHLRAHET